MDAFSLFPSDQFACIINAENYSAYYAGENYCPSLHIFMFDLFCNFLGLLGNKDWLIAISAAITAAFTAILGISTIGLWKQTAKAAAIAERAIELSESGSLTIDTWSVEHWGSTTPIVNFSAFNGGRNTVEIIETICRARINTDLPEVPDYSSAPISAAALVAAGTRTGIKIEPPVAAQQIIEIEANMNALFIYGRITFKTAQFNTVWELGFAQRITFPANAIGIREAKFEYPTKPGFNFLRPKTSN